MYIEWIKEGDCVFAIIIRNEYKPQKTEFITPPDYKQQIGFIVYKAGESIEPHIHKPLPRNFLGTSEVLLVKSGRLEVSIYNNDKKLLTKKILHKGDIILLVNGGHGFKMIEDTVLLEIKQGPYIGPEEKERFEG